MATFIYMVRHGESPKLPGGTERSRGLTAKGEADARKITEKLRFEGIEVFYSSPYLRAIHTITGLAQELGAEIQSIEDLREIHFLDGNRIMPDQQLYPLLATMFADTDFVPVGGESIHACQKRSVSVLQDILKQHSGQKVAIGTHGAVMTLMMNYFDAKYDLDFLLQTTKPDIYKMEFTGAALVGVERL
ncbi:histidine phosphatase family protein [Paenibacillus sp. VTT E-133280]|jgi:2,3-bisphosphoglycerate-dependent phosphoglycerate mutase|uniref:histidine phosphatase family protein n=1 Tax=Paenibacillus sp. VTT E-133280 TaxID=1986222 RepID=UPI000BA02E9D|nr:histidine phosphatase family protein [Paenibacillus sp. VTT E-133280]OZQ62962.1 histidine phosphatase family protein [Paenibacillus sp. VTT E-133280]